MGEFGDEGPATGLEADTVAEGEVVGCVAEGGGVGAGEFDAAAGGERGDDGDLTRGAEGVIALLGEELGDEGGGDGVEFVVG